MTQTMNRTCSHCQKSYTKRSKQAYWQFEASLFCSKSCKGKAQGFKTKEQPKKICIICGSEYSKDSKQPKSWWKNSKFCSQSCYQIESSVFMNTLRYRGKENWTWRKSILERDKYTCKMHNEDCTNKIEVHHILRYSEFPELRYDLNNGITLCSFHHPKKKVEEKLLERYFKKLIWQQ